MLWQGQEFSAPRGWAADNQKLSYRPLEWDWMLVPRGVEHFKYYQTLIRQRLKNPALFQGQLKKMFRYDAAKTIVYGFEDTTTSSRIMVVANLHPYDQTPANVPWLAGGTWYDIFDQSQFIVSGNSVASFPIKAYTAKVYSNKTDSQLGITSVQQYESGIPADFTLSQNYPNPFNPGTTIQYQIPSAGMVTLKVFDVLGREVAMLVHQMQSAGNYSAYFDASHLTTGLYFYSLQVGALSDTRKMMLVK
jgi:hypothetical protein